MDLQADHDLTAEDRTQRGLVMMEVLRRVARLLCQDGWYGPAMDVEAAVAALEEDAKQGKMVDSAGR